MPAEGHLAVVVVNYRTSGLVEANLLRSLDPDGGHAVVIVDNVSDAAERAAITEVCARNGWQLLTPDHNTGFGGGVNLAARHALAQGAGAMLVVNPDAWLEDGTVAGLLDEVRANPMALISPMVLRPDGRVYSGAVDLHLDTGEMTATRKRPAEADPAGLLTWVSGACFIVSAELWNRCGGFDEDYFLYWEDVDLCKRVVDAGGSVVLAEHLVAVHAEGQSHGFDGPARAKSPLYYYYNTRNRLLFAAKHLDPADRRRWVRATPRVSWRILMQGGRRQLVRPRQTIWPAFRGSLTGYRQVLSARRGERW